MNIKKGDMVVVHSGLQDKARMEGKARSKKGMMSGKRGKVLRVLTKTDRVVVEGLNLRKKHMKAQGQLKQAGIIDIEGSIHVSNVALYCDKCKRGVRTGKKVLSDGKKVRYCKVCGETFND